MPCPGETPTAPALSPEPCLAPPHGQPIAQLDFSALSPPSTSILVHQSQARSLCVTSKSLLYWKLVRTELLFHSGGGTRGLRTRDKCSGVS